MNDTNNIKNDPATLADNIAHPNHETKAEAKERQIFMPLVGSIIAALILFALLGLFLGWF